MEYSAETVDMYGDALAAFVKIVRMLPEHKRTLDTLSTAVVKMARLFPAVLQDEVTEALSTLLDSENLVVNKPVFLCDPEYVALMRGDLCWGDIECPPSTTPKENLDEDWYWSVPALKLRRDIWDHFPVTVVPLGSGEDGAERHAIVWHRKNLAMWRAERSEDMHEWMHYDAIQERRLLKALRASPRWTVEPAQTPDQICVIRMNFVVSRGGASDDEEECAATPTSSPVLTAAAPAMPAAAAGGAGAAAAEEWTTVKKGATPLLLRLNDIKERYPVVWSEVPSLTRAKVYAIEIFGKRARELGLDIPKTTESLLRALKASPSWRVLRPEGGREVCRIEMNA
jgi:hypothetical protein